MNKPRKFPHVKKAAFLAAYEECGTVTRAAKAAGIDRNTHNDWLAKDSGYAQAFEQACLTASENLEAEARRRAQDGLMRMKFHKGMPIIDPRTLPTGELFDERFPVGKPYFEHEYSDVLLIFLLKGARPDKYRDNLDVTSGGAPIKLYSQIDPARV